MGGSRIRPKFQSLAGLENERAKGSLDRTQTAEQADEEQARVDGAAEGQETPTISVYQDPRDELDLERHQMGGIGSR